MRHRKSVVKLGRTPAHRKAVLSNLSAALFERKHIMTTEAKAKATQQASERLITLAKKGTLHARRLALKHLYYKRIVKILFEEIAPQYAERNGGYTRVIKVGQRSGDGARMAVLELVGFEMASKKKKEKEVKEEKKKTKKASKEAQAEVSASEDEKSKASKKAKKDKADKEDKVDKAELKPTKVENSKKKIKEEKKEEKKKEKEEKKEKKKEQIKSDKKDKNDKKENK